VKPVSTTSLSSPNVEGIVKYLAFDYVRVGYRQQLK
jgi:hypothetical protein